MINFVLDEDLLASGAHGHLIDDLASEGYRVHLEKRQSSVYSDPIFTDTGGECTVLYGSIQFVEQRLRNTSYSPGAYYSRERFRCSHYMHRLPLAWLGNADYVCAPFAELRRRHEHFYRLFGVSRLFIRPDSGAKVFTGLAVTEDDIAQEMNSLMQLTSVTDDTMTLVAPAKRILSEYRFYIVEGKVVTASRYMVDGNPSASPDVHPECLDLAHQVASCRWQVDVAYTCDIGLFDEPGGCQAKIVELNAFSTSGLYECDSLALFKAVACAALKEHRLDISVED